MHNGWASVDTSVARALLAKTCATSAGDYDRITGMPLARPQSYWDEDGNVITFEAGRKACCSEGGKVSAVRYMYSEGVDRCRECGAYVFPLYRETHPTRGMLVYVDGRGERFYDDDRLRVYGQRLTLA